MPFWWAVGWFGVVPEDVRACAVPAADGVMEMAVRKAGGPRGGVLFLLVPVGVAGAAVMRSDERSVPRRVRDLAAGCGARYVVAFDTGLVGWGPELVEAVLAHELGHVVLGHCDGHVTRWLS